MEKDFTKTLLGQILNGAKKHLNSTEQKQLDEAMQKELTERPFRVAVIGQSGVGKSTTLNSVFGLKNYVSNIKEGTTDVIEKIFPVKDGFNLAIYDMPGLNNSVEKDLIYEKMYREILPTCDVIVYIISAHSRDIGEDCRILKEIVLPICKENNVLENLIIALNKIDTIGESEDPNDPELQWDIVENKPTPKLLEKIIKRIKYLGFTLIDEGIYKPGELKNSQILGFSAVFNYNMQDFLDAILNTQRGFIWIGTYGLDRMGRWSDAKAKI